MAKKKSGENEDGSVTLKLSEPIQFGSETIDSLTFTKPKARHLRKLPAQDMSMDDILNLAGTLAAQPKSVIDELSWKDVEAVGEVINSFL